MGHNNPPMTDPLKSPPQISPGTVELRRSAEGAWQLVFTGDWRAGGAHPLDAVIPQMDAAKPLDAVTFIVD